MKGKARETLAVLFINVNTYFSQKISYSIVRLTNNLLFSFQFNISVNTYNVSDNFIDASNLEF